MKTSSVKSLSRTDSASMDTPPPPPAPQQLASVAATGNIGMHSQCEFHTYNKHTLTKIIPGDLSAKEQQQQQPNFISKLKPGFGRKAQVSALVLRDIIGRRPASCARALRTLRLYTNARTLFASFEITTLLPLFHHCQTSQRKISAHYIHSHSQS